MDQPELEDLLARHDPVAPGDRRAQAVQQRRLPGLRAAGHQDVETRDHRGMQEARRLRGQRTQLDELVETGGTHHELADIDGGEAAGDPVEHHVHAMTRGKRGVDERQAQVDPATAGLEQPLDQLVDLCTRQDGRGQLMPPVARDEHPRRVVDPYLLDRGVVEVLLQSSVTGHPGQQLVEHRRLVPDRGDCTGQALPVVLADDVLRDPSYGGPVDQRVDPLPADGVAQPRIQHVDRRRTAVRGGEHRHVPDPENPTRTGVFLAQR
jgi:hypothetical protein